MENKTRNLVLVALFASLTAIGAYIEIPTQPVPITLQILFSMYAGVLLGGRLGFLSQIGYILMGLVGLPVFAGGVGGFHYILSPTFGYLIGFALCSYGIGKFTENIVEIKGIKGFIKILLVNLTGLIIVYSVGVPYLYYIIKLYLGKSITISGALKTGLYPFIIQDIVKSIFVAITALKVLPAIRRTGYVKIKRRKEI
ncbi:biotin transporter BioY [Sporosalibacterium faouarense]|uniref:biotin transporter BioY n=1 Tax=Sporosalibacterium faouarense TaxID=516123 RepID=UPI00141C682E|nr:biotin transporter BioY [Sporosalibacterium faouarense]MTI48296.1 biotin transporter BioY [Bacillota bacterium]